MSAVVELALTAQQHELALRVARPEQGVPALAAGFRHALAQFEPEPGEPYLRRPPHRPRSPLPALGRPVADVRLAPGSAAALRLRAGRGLLVEQVSGGQCVDLQVFALADRRERLSAARTRVRGSLNPTLGARLWSTPPGERALMEIVRDDVGAHDLGFPMCTPGEYRDELGLPAHLSCHELLTDAARREGLDALDLHDPLNLFLPSVTDADGRLRSRPCPARAGDVVVLAALHDVLVLACPCPDDVFGSSRFAPCPVRLAVLAGPRDDELADGHGARTDVVTVSAHPARSLALRLATHPVELSTDELARLDSFVADGRFGADRAEALRSVLLFWATSRSDPERARSVPGS